MSFQNVFLPGTHLRSKNENFEKISYPGYDKDLRLHAHDRLSDILFFILLR